MSGQLDIEKAKQLISTMKHLWKLTPEQLKFTDPVQAKDLYISKITDLLEIYRAQKFLLDNDQVFDLAENVLKYKVSFIDRCRNYKDELKADIYANVSATIRLLEKIQNDPYDNFYCERQYAELLVAQDGIAKQQLIPEFMNLESKLYDNLSKMFLNLSNPTFKKVYRCLKIERRANSHDSNLSALRFELVLNDFSELNVFFQIKKLTAKIEKDLYKLPNFINQDKRSSLETTFLNCQNLVSSYSILFDEIDNVRRKNIPLNEITAEIPKYIDKYVKSLFMLAESTHSELQTLQAIEKQINILQKMKKKKASCTSRPIIIIEEQAVPEHVLEEPSIEAAVVDATIAEPAADLEVSAQAQPRLLPSFEKSKEENEFDEKKYFKSQNYSNESKVISSRDMKTLLAIFNDRKEVKYDSLKGLVESCFRGRVKEDTKSSSRKIDIKTSAGSGNAYFHVRHGRDRDQFIDPKAVLHIREVLLTLGLTPESFQRHVKEDSHLNVVEALTTSNVLELTVNLENSNKKKKKKKEKKKRRK